MRDIVVTLVLLAPVFVSSFGCAKTDPPPLPDERSSGLVTVDIDKRDPDRLLRFYFGSYAEQLDSVLVDSDGRYLVDLEALGRSGFSLKDADADGNIDWDELSAFVVETYYQARRIPSTIDSLRTTIGDWHDENWFRISVAGVMTAATRDVYVRRSAILAALRNFESAGTLVYPDSTAFVAEHRGNDGVTEYTVMLKRHDGLWDVAAYGAEGLLADSTLSHPKSYTVPTQCLGCHYGKRLFEPEKSFPGTAPRGPGGERAVLFPTVPVAAGDVALLDEHRRRSDTVLGLYATLFVSSLRARSVDDLSDDELHVLQILDSREGR